jgi:hypothetical protein
MLAAAAGAVGLYFATVWVEMLPVTIAAALGLAGMAGASYFLLSV